MNERSHRQAGYETWNNKTIEVWYSTTVGTRFHQSRKEVGLQSIHNFTHTCKNSYMLRLYVHSHHHAGYETLNKKTIKIHYNTRSCPYYCMVLYCIVFL